MWIDEFFIRSASKTVLEKIQNELFSKICLTDYEIYLYELIDKQLSKMEEK